MKEREKLQCENIDDFVFFILFKLLIKKYIIPHIKLKLFNKYVNKKI